MGLGDLQLLNCVCVCVVIERKKEREKKKGREKERRGSEGGRGWREGDEKRDASVQVAARGNV